MNALLLALQITSANPDSVLNTIRNYVRVSDRLGTSGQIDSTHIQTTADEGFEVVINLATASADRNGTEGLKVAEAGMTYHADWVHDERPSPLITASGARMVALPYTYELNDAPILMRSHLEGEAFARRWIAQFDRIYREGDAGRMVCLVLHPFAIGQPHRIRYLDRILQHIRDHSDVWVATASQIVDHYLEFGYDQDLAASSDLHDD